MKETKTEIVEHARVALRGLKDFQSATVDVVHKRLFGEGQKSMLVADEVGLGKTIVAKGIIAKELIARMEAGKRSPLRVTYVCSNQVIAGENVDKLNIFPKRDVVDHVQRRIAYLAYATDDEECPYRNLLALNTLTPGTSFRISRSPGRQDERMIMYALLCEDESFLARKKGLSCLLRGPVRKAIEQWRGDLVYHRQRWQLREDLAGRYVAMLRRERLPATDRVIRDAIGIEGRISLYDAALDLAGILRANNEHHYHDACLRMIRALRRQLIYACLNYVDADLYILDEFQRFRTLIDTTSEAEEALIARRVFDQRRARVLLLSATPFKAFTGDVDHANGEDHYRDFGTVLRFLVNGDPEKLSTYDKHRGALYRQLINLDPEHLNASVGHRKQVEDVLRTVMCRTERHSVASDPSSMIADCWREETVPFSPADITNFTETDHIVEVLSRVYDRGRHAVNRPVEYCKSAPFPLSFLDGYVLKKTLGRMRKNAEVRRAILGNRAAWLNATSMDDYGYVVGVPADSSGMTYCAHARLAQLADKSIGPYGAALLWVPPSLPYYPLQGAFSNASGFSKTLVFSAWVMVPRMIASLLSYEVERRTVGNPTTKDERETTPRTYFPPEGKKNYRRHPVPLLTFSRAGEKSAQQVQNMSNFCLLYPSPRLAQLLAVNDMVSGGATLNELRSRLSTQIKSMISDAGLHRFETAAGEPEKWYWAAAPLLDRASSHHRRLIDRWLYRHGPEAESGYFCSGGSERGAKSDHFIALREALKAPTEIGLGRMPEDLPDVLAEMVLGSPAVVALRSLRSVFGLDPPQADDLADTVDIAGEFLNLLNKPKSICAVRMGAPAGSFWWQALRYCTDGCLQAVFDEYFHLLKGQTTDRARAVQTMVHTINLATASINVDSAQSFVDGRPHKMRCHYAVEFGNQKIETEDGQSRASGIRANFNSPFRPFVLATTSIGQEGLDFHQYCRRIVHWNLPSNPIDLEQREGRINRYKGLVVRQQLARRYGDEVRQANADRDVWDRLFAIADRRERVETGKCELVPYWHVDTDGIRIERVVPMYPFSRDEAKLIRILKTLAIYRLAFGQPRQVELVEHLLQKKLSPAQISEICAKLMVNLSPITY